MNKKKGSESIPFALRSIYLREASQWMSDGFDPSLPKQALVGQFRATGHKIEVLEIIENTANAETIRTCRVTSNFDFRYLSTPPDIQPDVQDDSKYLVAKISAHITVDYLITSDEIPPQEKVQQWASTSALLHCWPYWREFCHSTLLRMNLPVTMMPMMEVNHKVE
ncbi:MAG: hypothetical protein PHU06_12490 [Gallionella sp.]|nr:hypothetical protein [Gallionella sp.]MDD4959441.1 hypothetical protein [Gallionella sp.]